MPAWGSRSKDRAIGSAVAPPTIDPLLPAAMPSPPPLRSRSAGAPRWFAALVAGMLLLAKGQRLSIQPLAAAHYELVLELAGA